MAADLIVAGPARPGSSLRRVWLAATVVLTLGPMALAVSLAPALHESPPAALVWLLFVGSSVHVGATAWFYTVAEVRRHMRQHRWRYYRIPVALVVGTALVTMMVPAAAITWLLVGYFAWQFFHFQRQNLGVAALAAKAVGVARLSGVERATLTAAGMGGIAWLVGHPALLQLGRDGALGSGMGPGLRIVSLGGAVVFVVAVLAGGVAVLTRERRERRASFLVVYGVSLGFFLPVFLFESPYAAVAGLTIAHGMQYLLLMSLVSGAPSEEAPARVGVLIFLNLAVVLGLGLNQASHLHGSPTALGRCLFGAYLGVVMAHFVVDAGLWRLREVFPRTFLTQRLPYLFAPA